MRLGYRLWLENAIRESTDQLWNADGRTLEHDGIIKIWIIHSSEEGQRCFKTWFYVTPKLQEDIVLSGETTKLHNLQVLAESRFDRDGPEPFRSELSIDRLSASSYII
jgi:hypothetical protein